MNVLYEKKDKPIILMQTQRVSPLPHMHKEVEIVYVKKGSATAHADNECQEISNGDIFVSFPNQVHFYEKSTVGKYYVIIISPKVFYGIKELLYSNIPTKNTFAANKILKDYLKQFIARTTMADVSGSAGYINLVMSEILSNIELTPNIKSADGTLREIMDYCENHFYEEISLSSVAEGTHLSRCYISHLFGEKLSISFTDYINILRVNAACELLAETDKKISDISEDVGYGTIRSFNRAFVKIMGQSPQNYRSGLI